MPPDGRRTGRERSAKSLQSKRKLPVRRLLLAGSSGRRLAPRVRIRQPGGLRRPGGFRREVEQAADWIRTRDGFFPLTELNRELLGFVER
jgi:hypothetical protein